MDSSTRPVPDETDTLRLVAERLRRLRRANGLSLRQLAEATGTSASFLSQLERGLTGASASTLIRIANCFGTSISELFSTPEVTRDPVLRRAQRPALPVTDGQRKMLLSRRPLTHFETYVSEFDVGGSTGPEQYTHGDSHEMFIVLRGSVRLELGPVHHEMHAGDSVEYATSVPHRVANIGDVVAEVLFIISPPDSTATYLDTYRAKGE